MRPEGCIHQPLVQRQACRLCNDESQRGGLPGCSTLCKGSLYNTRPAGCVTTSRSEVVCQDAVRYVKAPCTASGLQDA